MSFSLTPALIDAQALGESGGNLNIGRHSNLSTASGGWGFTDPTWQGLMQGHPELGLTMQNKNDPETQRKAYAVLGADNAKTLQGLGVTPNASTVSLAAFLGPQAAAAFAKSDPNANVSDVLTQAIGAPKAALFMQSNPTILKPDAKVGDVIAYNDKTHVTGAGAGGQAQPGSYGASAQPMPSDFGQPTRGPSPVTQVDQRGTDGDTLINVGLAMMGGARDGTGFTDAAKAYQAATDRQQALAIRNAELKESATKRDWDEPSVAARTAYERAIAWNQMQAPTTLTAEQAAKLQEEHLRNQRQDNYQQQEIGLRRDQLRQSGDQFDYSKRQQDDQFRSTKEQQDREFQQRQDQAQKELELRQRQFDEGNKTTQTLIGGTDPSNPTIVQMNTDKTGKVSFVNSATGEVTDRKPDGIFVPTSSYNAQQHQQAILGMKTEGSVDQMLKAGSGAQERVDQINQAQTAANQPGSHAGSDVGSSVMRAMAPVLGLNTNQDFAGWSLAQVGQAVTSQAAKGQGAVSDYERTIFQKLAPSMGTDPNARNQAFDIMRDIARRPDDLAKAWMAASPAEKAAAKSSPSAFAEWQYQNVEKIANAQREAREKATGPAATAQAGGQTGGGGTPQRKPLGLLLSGGSQAPAAPQGPPPSPYAAPGGQNLQPMRSYAGPPGSGGGDGAAPAPPAPPQAPPQPPPQASEGGLQPGQGGVTIRDPVLYQQAMRSQATQILRANPSLGYIGAARQAMQMLGPPPDAGTPTRTGY